jgi:thiamine-monophosphate kinase
MTELELIERILVASRTHGQGGEPARRSVVRVGIGDDCAVLRVPPGHEMIVTTDFSLEGRHFRRDWHTAESVGHRCLVRGLSDVAAMGGQPLAVFLSLALPRGFDVGWLDGFLAGFLALARAQEVELAGGDTAEAPGDQIVADVVVTGAVRTGKALRRAGAAVGDGVYCTGSLGGAAVELGRLAAGGSCGVAAAEGGSPHCFPEARIRVGQALVRRRLASACMDLSDGLSTDLRHLCTASGVGAEVDLAALPLGTGASVEQAVHGGEDYELLFTSGMVVPKEILGVAVTRIGTVTAEGGVRVAGGGEMVAGGFEHFSG